MSKDKDIYKVSCSCDLAFVLPSEIKLQGDFQRG